MRVYTVSSDPAIAARTIRIVGDEVAIVLSKAEAEILQSILMYHLPDRLLQRALKVALSNRLNLVL